MLAIVDSDDGLGSLELEMLSVFEAGDLQTWILGRTTPILAEDACRSFSASRAPCPC